MADKKLPVVQFLSRPDGTLSHVAIRVDYRPLSSMQAIDNYDGYRLVDYVPRPLQCKECRFWTHTLLATGPCSGMYCSLGMRAIRQDGTGFCHNAKGR